ncbi:DUF4190 domain-containing protein [Priestia sp. GS2]|uniref:DUF4190 domain-containing protein n=1 Tax=Priestia sp. GS2 TaxID=3117403 RepID=UPI002ED89DB6
MEKTNSKSIVSLILGVLSLAIPYIGIIIGVAGLLFSVKSTKEIKKNLEKGKGFALTGGIFSTLGIGIQAVMLALAIIGYTALFF